MSAPPFPPFLSYLPSLPQPLNLRSNDCTVLLPTTCIPAQLYLSLPDDFRRTWRPAQSCLFRDSALSPSCPELPNQPMEQGLLQRAEEKGRLRRQEDHFLQVQATGLRSSIMCWKDLVHHRASTSLHLPVTFQNFIHLQSPNCLHGVLIQYQSFIQSSTTQPLKRPKTVMTF